VKNTTLMEADMRIRLMALAAALVMVTAPSAYAQRVEVSGIFGWTLSDGVTGDPILALDGNVYDTVDLKDGFSWGVGVGVNATDNVEVGFLFGQQMSTLAVEGTTRREVGDLTINTYHPYVAFNLGEADARVRPYFLIGLGATNYGSVDFVRANGQADETDSATQFSTTWGAGVKVFPSPKVGIKFGVHWVPTYIKTDAAGYWCDPYWGCYVVGDAQYSNQFQFNGGITFRF
jgi:opacity protein-like surface antigen